jgi:hypothetical protein
MSHDLMNAKWQSIIRAEIHVLTQGSLVAIQNPACLVLITVVAQYVSFCAFVPVRTTSARIQNIGRLPVYFPF